MLGMRSLEVKSRKLLRIVTANLSFLALLLVGRLVTKHRILQRLGALAINVVNFAAHFAEWGEVLAHPIVVSEGRISNRAET